MEFLDGFCHVVALCGVTAFPVLAIFISLHKDGKFVVNRIVLGILVVLCTVYVIASVCLQLEQGEPRLYQIKPPIISAMFEGRQIKEKSDSYKFADDYVAVTFSLGNSGHPTHTTEWQLIFPGLHVKIDAAELAMFSTGSLLSVEGPSGTNYYRQERSLLYQTEEHPLIDHGEGYLLFPCPKSVIDAINSHSQPDCVLTFKDTQENPKLHLFRCMVPR